MARTRKPLPSAEDAAVELAKLKRSNARKERRAARTAAMQAQKALENPEITEESLPKFDADELSAPTLEELKGDLMFAFKAMGGRANLVVWGQRYPKEFYNLWARYCLPKEDSKPEGEATGLEALLAQLDSRGETKQ